MRFLPLIVFLLALDTYAFQAFRTVAQNWAQTTQTSFFILFWSIPILAIILMFLYTNTNYAETHKAVFSFLRAIVFIAYLSKVLIIALLLIDDFRRLGMRGYELFAGNKGFDYSRSQFLSKLGIALGSIPFLSLTYGIIRNPYRYKLFKQTVKVEGLPKKLDGLKIVQISDVHSGSFTFKEPVKNAIEMINQQKADLVFFTGDLVNNVATEMEHFTDVFDKIKARFGVFSVLGNHDYGDYVAWPSQEHKIANLEKLKDTHKKMGWQLLLNENRLLDINEEKVAVIGVENYSAHPRFPKYGDLATAHRGTETAGLKLLLSHDPSHWHDQVTSSYQDIDITFSGHTHGMQFGIEIPGWIRWSPVQYVYKQWAGLYKSGRQFLYVNRGFGFLGYPGRVGILPEITVMELKSDTAYTAET